MTVLLYMGVDYETALLYIAALQLDLQWFHFGGHTGCCRHLMFRIKGL